jgi:hypothetical protein
VTTDFINTRGLPSLLPQLIDTFLSTFPIKADKTGWVNLGQRKYKINIIKAERSAYINFF